MELTPLSRSVQAADIPMEKLAGNAKVSEQEKVGEVSRQFEAVLLRQILQHAQKTHFPSKFSGDSATSGIYQDMVTNQLADGISKSGAFGLAQSIRQQLTQQLPLKAHGKV
jgi:Rod binding domain-containing protein